MALPGGSIRARHGLCFTISTVLAQSIASCWSLCQVSALFLTTASALRNRRSPDAAQVITSESMLLHYLLVLERPPRIARALRRTVRRYREFDLTRSSPEVLPCLALPWHRQMNTHSNLTYTPENSKLCCSEDPQRAQDRGPRHSFLCA